METEVPDSPPPRVTGPHGRHCFVVMPFGRDAEEERWFRGWYEVVIEPVVAACGYHAVLAATEDQPAAINDDIRSHLVFDPMVVVDLGGRNPTDPPNANVMYELGIRHAFGRPLVIMAWEGQRLPFDVSNQRAIFSRRDFRDIDPTRQKLSRFIKSAEEGRFYKPMEAVGREAAIDATSLVLGEESLLAALAKEVRDLRSAVTVRRDRVEADRRRRQKVSNALGKTHKEALWPFAKELGYDPNSWGKLLSQRIDAALYERMCGWTLDDWKTYLTDLLDVMAFSDPTADTPLTETFIQEVKSKLPPQPWPTGVHKTIATELNSAPNHVTRAIQALISRGDYFDQHDGVLIGSQPTVPMTRDGGASSKLHESGDSQEP